MVKYLKMQTTLSKRKAKPTTFKSRKNGDKNIKINDLFISLA